MANLQNIMDVQELERLVNEHYITRKFHPEFPLAILNYSPTAQFDRDLIWDDTLSVCRGLIYNSKTFDIVARPFAKFWNLNTEGHPETLEENLPTDRPLVTTKMDGSLGILYPWAGQNYVATRGSFQSEQSSWATEWLQRRYPRLVLPQEYTLLTEVIYDLNQIVCRYDFEGLIVLGAIHMEIGKELSRSDLKSYCIANGLTIVQDHKKELSTCKAEDIPNQEGYVLTYANGLKVKCKFTTYCQLHRILTGLNPKSVWEMKRDGKDDELQAWLDDPKIPEGFKTWLSAWLAQFDKDVFTIFGNASRIYGARPKTDNRKEIAEFFLQDENRRYAPISFGLLDGKDVTDMIWKMVKPKSTDVFREDGE
jgi:RNA ligase